MAENEDSPEKPSPPPVPQPPERPRPPQVVPAEVVTPVQTSKIGRKIKQILFTGNLKSAGIYATEEVLFPSIRGTILEFGHSILDNLFGGGRAPRRNDGPREYYDSRPRTQYATRSTGGLTRFDRDRDRRMMESRMGFNRRYDDFRLVTVPSRADAERILDTLDDWCHRVGFVTVADYYDTMGLRPSNTDVKWGWYSLRSVQVKPHPNGWILDMPPAEPIRED